MLCGMRLLAGHDREITSLDPLAPTAGILLGLVAQWVDTRVGTRVGTRVRNWYAPVGPVSIGPGRNSPAGLPALCRAISLVTGMQAAVQRYEIRGVTSGAEAMGEVNMQMEQGGRKVAGRGASTDVLEASARAYIDGLNKLANLPAVPLRFSADWGSGAEQEYSRWTEDAGYRRVR